MSDDDLIRRGDALACLGTISVSIDRAAIAALPAATVGEPNVLDDGRPCVTDVFLAAAIEQLDDKWDLFEAVKDWCEGDWDGALLGVELPALTPTPVDDSQTADPAVKPTEDAGEMLERLGMDGVKWAEQFRTTALRLGYSDMDEGWLIGWFCNAIMAGYDRRKPTLAEALAVLIGAFDKIEAAQRETGQEFPTAAWLEFRAALAALRQGGE